MERRGTKRGRRRRVKMRRGKGRGNGGRNNTRGRGRKFRGRVGRVGGSRTRKATIETKPPSSTIRFTLRVNRKRNSLSSTRRNMLINTIFTKIMPTSRQTKKVFHSSIPPTPQTKSKRERESLSNRPPKGTGEEGSFRESRGGSVRGREGERWVGLMRFSLELEGEAPF